MLDTEMKEIVIRQPINIIFASFIMAFISSKLIQRMESVFRMSEDTSLVKNGETELLQLRKQPQYQLALANFLSRQSNHHHRIFVSLELEKRIIILNTQTVRILLKSYFEDLDKIAAILRKVLTHPENLSWAGDLLIYNFDAMGIVESIRYIELLYDLLQGPTQAERLVQQHFELLLSSYSQLADVVAESEDSLFMFLVTLGMFYRSSLSLNQSFFSKISEQWTFITDKCKYYGTPYIDLLAASIEISLHLHSCPYFQGSLGQLVFSILSSQLNGNEMKTKYEGKCLELLLQSGNVFADRRTVIEVIDSFNLYSRRVNQNKLLQSSLKCITELSNELQEEMENKYEVRARHCLHQLIEEVFQVHYKSVVEEYREQAGKPLYLYMMPLVNYYSSCRCSSIEEWVRDHIERTINHLGWFLSSVKFQDKNQGMLINDCVSCLELLVRFKALIPIKLLPHIGTVLQLVSDCCSSLSALCYQFLEQVWEEIANLDFSDLTDFLFNHLQKLNFNEWNHCLHFYTCYLNLALHLQDHYQFYSHLLMSDSLILQSLKTHSILVDLLMDTPESEIDLEVVSKLITLTGSIFLGLGGEQMLTFHGQLKVSFMADLLERHQLYRKENVKVVVWQWLVTGRMVISLEFRSALDNSQDGDETFRELIRNQIEHFQGLKTAISGF